ncbi:MAG: Stp1/IreP family PP2C-type Ser/Thr phosphatase [Rhodocyclaceae bacterium]|nr:Stp1/IreP family PP2C-type Ser/Thr phosphatase [Rhodocyclaceae bacterium]
MDLSKALEVATLSDKGMVRSHNEDAVFADAAAGVVILADGMGGYNAGEVASGMTTALLSSELAKSFAAREPDSVEADGRRWAQVALATEIARTNAAIHQAAQSQPQYAGMGTTLVTAVFHDNAVTVAHIGDSRLYRLRGEEFGAITRDHSLLQEQIDSGVITPEQARHSQNKNLVTRALGIDPAVEPEIRDYDVRPGDIYLLCSDGLNDMVEDDEIAMTLQALSANLEVCAMQLVQMANDNGGRDNVSVILVRVKEAFPAPSRGGWWARFLAWFKLAR